MNPTKWLPILPAPSLNPVTPFEINGRVVARSNHVTDDAGSQYLRSSRQITLEDLFDVGTWQRLRLDNPAAVALPQHMITHAQPSAQRRTVRSAAKLGRRLLRDLPAEVAVQILGHVWGGRENVCLNTVTGPADGDYASAPNIGLLRMLGLEGLYGICSRDYYRSTMCVVDLSLVYYIAKPMLDVWGRQYLPQADSPLRAIRDLQVTSTDTVSGAGQIWRLVMHLPELRTLRIDTRLKVCRARDECGTTAWRRASNGFRDFLRECGMEAEPEIFLPVRQDKNWGWGEFGLADQMFHARKREGLMWPGFDQYRDLPKGPGLLSERWK